jgi:antitoxin HicB
MDEVIIRLHIEPLEDGGFVATSPDVPGLVAEGRSVTEAAETCIEHGDPLPEALIPHATVLQDLLVPVGLR